MMRKILHQILPELLQNYYGRKFPDFNIDISNDKNWDLVLNIALQNAKLFNQAPLTMANEIKTLIQNNSELSEYFTQVEIKAPGFILLKINSDRLVDWLVNTPTNWGNGEFYQGKKILIEFAQPNTHKPLHIGHLRNICLGESLARILESQNGQVFRANYQGDIGPHVAKCLWALQKYPEDMPSEPRQRALLLGKKYAEGTKLSDGRKATETVEAIPANPQNQAEVQVINRAIYDHSDPQLEQIYQITRQYCLDYLEEVYQQWGTHFDHLFFESEVWEIGKKLVNEHFSLFQESQGAIIFNGEEFGLTPRVFITSNGTPTYETKELGLALLEKQEFPADLFVHIVANEQNDYFRTVFQVMALIWPELDGKKKHISYGLVKLPTGKMGSRTGDAIGAEELVQTLIQEIEVVMKDRELEPQLKKEIIPNIARGAIKFMMLHTQAKNDIIFDLQKATRLDGDSGPYLQYAYTRLLSIQNKVARPEISPDFALFNDKDWYLVRQLQNLPYIVERCAKEFTTHHLSHYLLGICADFSSWYAENSVQNAEAGLKAARLHLVESMRITLQNGLNLLGIPLVSKM